jgi:hypothetical protein
VQEIDGYEWNALESSYALLIEEPATVGELLGRLRGKNYVRASLTEPRLEELLASCPQYFQVLDDARWIPLRATGSHNSAGIPIRRATLDQRPPFVYVSGGGSVYHSTPDCDLLWEGKEKARSEGKTLREIVELSLPAALELERVSRGCSGCVRGTASAQP